MNLRKLTELKEQVEKLQRDSDRAQGVLDQMMKTLREEYECDTIEDAESLLEDLKNKAAKAEQEFEAAHKEFTEKYAESIRSS